MKNAQHGKDHKRTKAPSEKQEKNEKGRDKEHETAMLQGMAKWYETSQTRQYKTSQDKAQHKTSRYAMPHYNTNNLIAAAVLILFCIELVWIPHQLGITGNAVAGQEYTDTIGISLSNSNDYLWQPKHYADDMAITSLSIDGTVKGEGTLRVLFDGKTVLEQKISKGQKQQVSVQGVCKETCIIADPLKQKHMLSIKADKWMEIQLDSVTYTIQKESELEKAAQQAAAAQQNATQGNVTGSAIQTAQTPPAKVATSSAAMAITREDHSDAVGLTFSDNSVYLWQPQQYKPDSSLVAIKLDGTISGQGILRVFFDDLILYEANNTTNNTNGVQKKITVGGACSDTCIMEKPMKKKHTISVQADTDMQVRLESIDYTIQQQIGQTTNTESPANATNVAVTSNNTINASGALETENAAMNVTENTTGNLTGNLLAPLKFQAPGADEELIQWNHNQTKRKPGAIAVFDGKKDYEIIENTQNSTFASNSIDIQAVLGIDPDTKGVFISKYDYLNDKYFQLIVSERGTIQFVMSDSDITIMLDTNGTYNDGQEHTIIASLNKTTAVLQVDTTEEITADTSNLGDISNDMPIAIGANAGYIPWMDQTLDNFKGSIKDVKIKYKRRGG